MHSRLVNAWTICILCFHTHAMCVCVWAFAYVHMLCVWGGSVDEVCKCVSMDLECVNI